MAEGSFASHGQRVEFTYIHLIGPFRASRPTGASIGLVGESVNIAINKRGRSLAMAGLAFAAALAATATAHAAELITNGDFETGTFAGWTVVDLAGSFMPGTWFIDAPGTTTPVSGSATSAAGGLPHGSFYAVSDQAGPGTHALLQTITVAPGAGAVILSFDLFVNDQSGLGGIVGPQGLDHNGPPNQHARVDILSAGAGPFDTGASVLANFYLGVDAGPNPHAFTRYVFDITALVEGGGSFVLRFAETDNQLFLNAGVDNVSVVTRNGQVPEPSTFLLLASALILGATRSIGGHRLRLRQGA